MRQPVFSRELPSSARPTVWIRALCEYRAAAATTAAVANGIVRRINRPSLIRHYASVIARFFRVPTMIAPESYREIPEFVSSKEPHGFSDYVHS
jgi:hypothetical protein